MKVQQYLICSNDINAETGRTEFNLSDMDSEYKIGFIRVKDKTFWASKGNKELHKAVVFLINGKEVQLLHARES